MRRERRKDSRSRYSGPAVDEITGLNPNTRRAWTTEDRGVLKSTEDGYDFENLLRAAAGAEVARQGVTRPMTRGMLLDAIVEDMLELDGLDVLPDTPRYVVACPMPKVDFEYAKPGWPSPVVKRLTGPEMVRTLADGDGALCIAKGLSPEELTEHFAYLARSGAASTFAIDAAGLLRRVRNRLSALERP
jgi:hypothetical protein